MSGCCNTCNFEFDNFDNKKVHYKSEWHRYNLKLMVDGFEAVTEDDFVANLLLSLPWNRRNKMKLVWFTVAPFVGRLIEALKFMLDILFQRLISHVLLTVKIVSLDAIVRPLLSRKEIECEEETHLAQDKFDPTCCFMCDLKNPTLDACVLHMQKKHEFLIPDVQYLKHSERLLTHLGLQVIRDYMCLYCNERCHPFSSLEAVRKHMEAKSHFRVRFCDGGELEQFYDFTTRDMGKDGKLMVSSCDADSVELGCGRYELILKGTTDNVRSTKTLGCREFSRYYKQYPRFEFANTRTKTLDLASR